MMIKNISILIVGIDCHRGGPVDEIFIGLGKGWRQDS